VSGRITFGSFNHRPKITPSVARLWAGILLALPNAQLVLKSRSFSDQQTRRSLQEMFTVTGVASDRIIFVSDVPSHFDHLDLYNRIDIGLDTFPYNGTTTICEALWMGVPVITLAGEIHPSRVGVSLLSNVGLPELIAESPQEYVDKAIRLACDLERLCSLRSDLRSRMADSRLMDEGEFTRSLECTYRQMWHGYGRIAET
jgi:predicted O-linked N-acetylglucosamine transferase (SPINDLY family)